KRLALLNCDNRFRVWDVGSNEELLAGKWIDVSSVALSPDGNMLAIGREFEDVALYDVSKSKHLGSIKAPSRRPEGLLFSPDGNRLLCGCNDTVYICDPKTHDVLDSFTAATPREPLWCLALSHDGKVLATTGMGKTIKLWKLPPNP